MNLLFLSVAKQTVKDDRGGGTNREVVVARRPPDGLENVVRPAKDVLGQPPAGPQHENLRADGTGEALTQRRERQPVAPGTRRSGDDPRQDPALALDVGDGGLEVGSQPYEGEGFLPGTVVGGSRAALPVLHDALDQTPQGRHRRGDVDAS